MENETGVIDESAEVNLIYRDELFVPVLKNSLRNLVVFAYFAINTNFR